MKSICLVILLVNFSFGVFSQDTNFNYSDLEFKKSSKKIVYNFGWDPNGLARPEKGLGENNMDSLVTFLQNNKNLKVRIDIHSDLRGAADFNKRVTARRIQTFKFYFKDKVDLKRVKFNSYGESQPLIPLLEIEKIEDKNKRNETHRKNDRIEITILEN